MSPDRTWKQQSEHKKLVKELQIRKSKGEERLVIKGGRIVQLDQPFRRVPQSYWGME